MRVSLLARLVVVAVVILASGMLLTAMLTLRLTVDALRDEQGQSLATDSRIYNTLLDWAATHTGWDGVGPTLNALAQHNDRRITLLTPEREPVIDSVADGQPLPATASAVIDPFAIDQALVPNAPADRIASAAVGPFRLPDNEKAHLDALAAAALNCVRERVGTGEIITGPSGRPRIDSPNQITNARCAEELDAPTPTELAALSQLDTLVNGCLARQSLTPVRLNLDRTWSWLESGPAGQDQAVVTCLASARREQLAPYVAPATQLFITSVAGDPWDLSDEDQLGLIETVLMLLTLAISLALLVGLRLTKPLRALTEGVERLRTGAPGGQVHVRGRDEIARLASAFNEMSASLERVDQDRKDLVSDIAHELRTPLTNIRGWLEAIEDGISDPDPELVASLLEEARLLQHIINDLQDLALADAGALRLHPTPVDVADLLDQVRAAHLGEAADEGVDLRVEAAPAPLTADPMRLRQALGNLVGNAIRHTPRGGTVTLRGSTDGHHVLLSVSDTGPGIAPEDLPHVFDRFWRAEKSRSRQTGGSGLGLAIVRKLAEAHGGSAAVASTPGSGATVTLRLPVTPERERSITES